MKYALKAALNSVHILKETPSWIDVVVTFDLISHFDD